MAVAGDGLGARVVTRLLGFSLLLALGATGAYAYHAWVSAEAAAAVARAGEAEPPRGLVVPRPPRRPEPPAKQPAADPPSRQGAEEPQPQQPVAELAASAQSAEEAERLRLRELEIAEQDRRRSAQIEADREERALKRARENLTVSMYATSWCPSCKAARAYMTERGIAFVEHDIDESESARLIMKRLNPRGSVPTLDIDGAVLVGFSGKRIDATLEAAARKRAERSL